MEEVYVSSYKHLLVVCLAIITATMAYVYQQSKQKVTKSPPGPPKLPFFGNILQILKSPKQKLWTWAHKFGDCYTIYFGTTPVLIINDVNTMREIFKHSQSTGKFVTDTAFLTTQGEYGIVNTAGKLWSEQRRFCMRGLKELGLGDGKSLESLLCQEAQNLCDWLKIKSGQSLVLNNVLFNAAVNTLWTITSGERLDLDDSTIGNLVKNLMKQIQYSVKTGLGLIPKLRYFIPNVSGYIAFKNASRDVHKFFEEKLKQHEESFMEGERRDLIEIYIAYMNKINNETQVGSSFYGNNGRANTLASLVELFIAGGESTSAMIHWILIYLAHNKDIQKKLQREIDQAIGKDSNPSMADSKRMPYTEAVILETFRNAPIAPLGVTHKLTDDLIFRHYLLPKDMLLVPNIYYAHHNPNIWKDSEKFWPDRFLVENGGECLKKFLVPYLVGKRRCPGERSANDLLFIFVVKLLQQFTVLPDPRISLEEYLKVDPGVLHLPRSLGLIIISRQTCC